MSLSINKINEMDSQIYLKLPNNKDSTNISQTNIILPAIRPPLKKRDLSLLSNSTESLEKIQKLYRSHNYEQTREEINFCNSLSEAEIPFKLKTTLYEISMLIDEKKLAEADLKLNSMNGYEEHFDDEIRLFKTALTIYMHNKDEKYDLAMKFQKEVSDLIGKENLPLEQRALLFIRFAKTLEEFKSDSNEIISLYEKLHIKDADHKPIFKSIERECTFYLILIKAYRSIGSVSKSLFLIKLCFSKPNLPNEWMNKLYFERIICYNLQKNCKEVQDEIRKIYSSLPENIKPYFLLEEAKALLENKQYADAKKSISMIRLNETSDAFQNEHAILQAKIEMCTNGLNKALEIIAERISHLEKKELTSRTKTDRNQLSQLYNLSGLIYEQKGQYATALIAFQKSNDTPRVKETIIKLEEKINKLKQFSDPGRAKVSDRSTLSKTNF